MNSSLIVHKSDGNLVACSSPAA